MDDVFTENPVLSVGQLFAVKLVSLEEGLINRLYSGPDLSRSLKSLSLPVAPNIKALESPIFHITKL